MSATPARPAGIRLGVARGISYGLFGPPEPFVEASAALGAGLVRAYLYWGQIEPRPGHFDWTVVDALLAELTPGVEAWVTVCSSSPWATREPTDFLPPSPARDAATYRRFVHALVSRCAGRVQYWQCDNEPSNVGLLWSGTAEEYAAQLAVFHGAVRDADPSAAVVLGGCGYDVLSSPRDGAPRRFFDQLLAASAGAFDLFDVHLYDAPRLIPGHIATVREMMRAHGHERPVVAGEYNGPTLFQFPDLSGIVEATMAEAFAGDAGGLSTGELAAGAGAETPERRALKALYARMPELPAALQMFMAGCPPELDARRDAINCREIVTRNLLAMAAGVRRTVCWHLAPEVPNYEDPYTLMELMHGKLLLLRHDAGGQLRRRLPAATAFATLAAQLDGAESVERLSLDDHPDVTGVVVERPGRQALHVIWQDAGSPTEPEQPFVIRWPWPGDTAVATDPVGTARRLPAAAGHVALTISATPTLLSGPPPARAAAA
jgi:hypothetical protein